LNRSAIISSSRSRGFSLVELATSLLLVLILTAIAIPSLMNSLRTYQLNDAATRVSDTIKFTRFEAVRRNTRINFLIQQQPIGGIQYWSVGTDSNGNGQIDPTERQQVLTGFATLLPSGGIPPATLIMSALNVASLTTLSGNPGSVTFDARGAVRTGLNGQLATNVSIIYLGNASQTQYGYRAVVLLPAGGTQVWMAPPGANWVRIG